MPWTPWITTEDENAPSEAVKHLYRKVRNPVTGKISDLNRITSLTPEVSENIFGLLGTPLKFQLDCLLLSCYCFCHATNRLAVWGRTTPSH